MTTYAALVFLDFSIDIHWTSNSYCYEFFFFLAALGLTLFYTYTMLFTIKTITHFYLFVQPKHTSILNNASWN